MTLLLEMPASREAEQPLDFDSVYREHAGLVARWAARLGGPLLDVEDAVQDVFMVVAAQLPRYRPEARFTTWLYRITQNVVSQKRRKDRIRRWLSFKSDEQALRELPAPGLIAVDELERQQTIRETYLILNAMSERYRTVLILFEMERLKGEEIAELLDAKIATVWVWLHRARADFLKRLEAHRAKERA